VLWFTLGHSFGVFCQLLAEAAVGAHDPPPCLQVCDGFLVVHVRCCYEICGHHSCTPADTLLTVDQDFICRVLLDRGDHERSCCLEVLEEVRGRVIDEADMESVLFGNIGWESGFPFDDGDDMGDANLLELFLVTGRPVIGEVDSGGDAACSTRKTLLLLKKKKRSW